ncbi:MAG: hypothetical protein BWY86_00566 [Candidatus Aminicenantes bacterium ADurb.Bin508]|nr:MAG: hypothetical protein BWY86_00566 [Candidatus Aminicenantes bacterium ADurb.Bin508]
MVEGGGLETRPVAPPHESPFPGKLRREGYPEGSSGTKPLMVVQTEAGDKVDSLGNPDLILEVEGLRSRVLLRKNVLVGTPLAPGGIERVSLLLLPFETEGEGVARENPDVVAPLQLPVATCVSAVVGVEGVGLIGVVSVLPLVLSPREGEPLFPPIPEESPLGFEAESTQLGVGPVVRVVPPLAAGVVHVDLGLGVPSGQGELQIGKNPVTQAS